MFDELEKYKSNGHFFFTGKDDLKSVCNAPAGLGIYLVYQLKLGGIELVYIGSSGKIYQKRKKKVQMGGIAHNIVNGVQFGAPRRKSWKEKVITENIDALDIYWYETFHQDHNDIPNSMRGIIMQKFYHIYGNLPRWNEEF